MKTFIFFLMLAATIYAQETCKIIIDEKSEKPMIIGETHREMFNDTSFAWWFNSEYDEYKINEDALKCLKNIDEDYKIEIVMGTWCSDSRREVPRFLKILDTLDFAKENIEIINVDRDKKDLNGKVDSLKIELVPTFIFYKDGKEHGRIIEVPENTLEEDFANIVQCKKEDEI